MDGKKFLEYIYDDLEAVWEYHVYRKGSKKKAEMLGKPTIKLVAEERTLP